jgi:glycosyltransferase involved in cell wall biosynthesis
VNARGSRVLVVLPGQRSRTAGVDARRLAAAQLARALGRTASGVEVLTPAGPKSPDELESEAVLDRSVSSGKKRAARLLPRPGRVLVGDALIRREAAAMREQAGRLEMDGYGVVVQMHRRFHDAGLILARRARIPIVLRLEALEVREEASWGISRPGWGGLVERSGELPLVRAADLVAAVSLELDRELSEIGVPAERRAVVPNGVDTDRFRPGPPDRDLLRQHGLEGRFVVGWVGGFRPFHGLESLPEVIRGLRDRVPEAALCLVGGGPEHARIRTLLAPFGEMIRFVPPVGPGEVPRWVRSFDACLVLPSADSFHYSPLKLFEYMATGRPVVAPAIGQISQAVRDRVDGILAPPGDVQALSQALAELARNAPLRDEIGARARESVARSASWDARAEAMLAAIDEPVPSGAAR